MRQAVCGCVVLLCLNGCAPLTPPCSDQKTVSLVKRILADSLTQSAAAANPRPERLAAVVSFEVLTIRAASIDEKVGKFFCEADARIKLPEDRTTQVLDFPEFKAVLEDRRGRVKVIDGHSLSADIKFTSQLTDDKSQHIVEVSGHDPLIRAGIRFGQVAELL